MGDGWLGKCARAATWPGEVLPRVRRHGAWPNEGDGARTRLSHKRGCSVTLHRRRKRRARGWLAPQDAVKEGTAHGLEVFVAGLAGKERKPGGVLAALGLGKEEGVHGGGRWCVEELVDVAGGMHTI